MSAEERLAETFVGLCRISSPTGAERAVADSVLGHLARIGVEAEEDGAAAEARAGAGNLIARIPGRGEAWVMLCAHLDTVPHDGAIEVAEEDGIFRSAGETILGADNKAAVAVLLALAERHASDPAEVGIELVFTVAEEDGLRGAKALEVGALRSRFGFVLDHATPIGEVLVSAPTYKRLEAAFVGQEAHAGINPEQGHSAIAAAAAAVDRMRLGRLDETTTANVGVIEGGSAANVVPGRCWIEGEARSVDGARAAGVVGAMVDACTWAASEHGCDLDVHVDEVFRGYDLDASTTSVRVAAEALRRTGHEPALKATAGGSDANALVAAGFDCVLLANGTKANHTPEETVTREALTEMLGVCEALVAGAAGEGE
jgi:tripeptide aminopeptidase